MPLKDESCAVVVICCDDVVVLADEVGAKGLRGGVGDRGASSTTGGVTSAKVAVPLSATVLAAAVVPAVSDWLALSLVDVKVSEPSVFNDAARPTPAVVSAALIESSELTLPAPATLLMVRVKADPVAGVKTSVSPWRLLVPPTVKSAAVPMPERAPGPVGAPVVAGSLVE